MEIDLQSDSLDDDAFEAWLAAHEDDDDTALPLIDDVSFTTNDTANITKKYSKKRKPTKLSSPQPEAVTLEDYWHGNISLRSGQSIETKRGDFLTISSIIQHLDTDEVFLRGRQYRRSLEVGNLLPQNENEVCWICRTVDGDSRDLHVRSLVQVPVAEFHRVRLILRTNRVYPALNAEEDLVWLAQMADLGADEHEKAVHDRQADGALVCRIKYIMEYATENDKLRERKPKEQSITALAQSECDQDDESIADLNDLRQQWRGPTTEGGSSVGLAIGEKEFHRQEHINSQGQKCCQSLTTSRKNYPKADPMQREYIGRHLNKEEIVSNGHYPKLDWTRVIPNVSKSTSKNSASRILNDDKRRLDGSTLYPLKRAKLAPTTPAPSGGKLSSEKKAGVGNLYAEIQRKIRRSPDRNERARKPFHLPRQRYEFADAFCGAGGMSRGAVMAGFKVVYGFDHDINPGKSFMANNFETMLYELEAYDFVHLPKHYDLRVDVLHLSPPCQFFSLAHTHDGRNDEKNIAAQFALLPLIERCKPRILTVEQTAGLALKKKLVTFYSSLIQTFTSVGYNVRWSLLQCADYGIPQRRQRLFIIASCPGEPLPPFPKPTHAQKPESTGLKPWNTIASTLASIPAEWPNHEVEAAIERDEASYSADKVTNCICTAGSILHPSGKRDFTDRELACLSTFPLCHKFKGNNVRKQIGNAVPPLMAKLLLEEVRKCLMKTDGIEWDGE